MQNEVHKAYQIEKETTGYKYYKKRKREHQINGLYVIAGD